MCSVFRKFSRFDFSKLVIFLMKWKMRLSMNFHNLFIFYSSKIYYLKTLIRCDWGMDTSISMNLSPKMLEQAGMNNDFVLMLEYDETLMYGTWQLLGNKWFPAGKQALSAFAATWQYMWYEESCFLDSSVLSEFCRVVFSKQFSVWNKIKV